MAHTIASTFRPWVKGKGFHPRLNLTLQDRIRPITFFLLGFRNLSHANPQMAKELKPNFSFKGKKIYIKSETETTKALKGIKEIIKVKQKLPEPLPEGCRHVFGFDLEWKPSFVSGKENKTAVLQLANEKTCYIFHISRIGKIPEGLVSLLQDPSVIKTGVSIMGDASKLYKDFRIGSRGLVDLAQYTRSKIPKNEAVRLSLAGLLLRFENRTLLKPKSVVLSNWELPLTEKQLTYAANDAAAGFAIFQQISALPPSPNPGAPPLKDLIRSYQPPRSIIAPTPSLQETDEDNEIKNNLPSRLQSTYNLYAQGKTVEQIATLRGVKSSTAENYLVEVRAFFFFFFSLYLPFRCSLLDLMLSVLIPSHFHSGVCRRIAVYS